MRNQIIETLKANPSGLRLRDLEAELFIPYFKLLAIIKELSAEEAIVNDLVVKPNGESYYIWKIKFWG